MFVRGILPARLPVMAPAAATMTETMDEILIPAKQLVGEAEQKSMTFSSEPFPEPPTFTDRYEEREYQKKRLALAFRIFAKLGFDEGVAGHITLRVSPFLSIQILQLSIPLRIL